MRDKTEPGSSIDLSLLLADEPICERLDCVDVVSRIVAYLDEEELVDMNWIDVDTGEIVTRKSR